jgi:hypothetical protein
MCSKYLYPHTSSDMYSKYLYFKMARDKNRKNDVATRLLPVVCQP